MDETLNKFEYSDIMFDIEKAKESLMTRAVRVKTTVMDKVGRIYGGVEKASPVATTPVVDNVLPQPVDEGKSFSDISVLSSEKPFGHIVGRVVLYTKQLVNKTERYSNNHAIKVEKELVIPTIEVTPEPVVIPEQEVKSIAPEVPSVDAPVIPEVEVKEPTILPSNEAVIPDTWDSLLNNMPAMDTIEKPTPNIPFPATEFASDETVKPISEPALVENQTFSFPTMDFAGSEVVNPIPEPAQVGTVEKPDFLNKLGGNSFDPMTLGNDAPSAMPNLFGNNENKEEEDRTPSKMDIKARVIRARNELKDSKNKIADLEGKIKILEAKSADQSRVLAGYAAAIENAVKEKDKAVRSNSQVQQEKEAIEAKYQALLETSNATIESLKKQNEEDKEKVRSENAALKDQYESRIATMTNNHNSEIKSLNDQHKKEMNTVYATITEVLGDTKDDTEEYSYSKAA